MDKKLYPITPINKNYHSVRIQIDKTMGVQPGAKYWQKKLPGGIIMLIPENAHGDDTLKIVEKNVSILELINTRLDRIIEIIRRLT